MTSYILSDRHDVVTDKSPAYLDKLLLATGIISGCSGLFNITAVPSPFPLKLSSINAYAIEYLIQRFESRKDENHSKTWNSRPRYRKGVYRECWIAVRGGTKYCSWDVQERFQESGEGGFKTGDEYLGTIS